MPRASTTTPGTAVALPQDILNDLLQQSAGLLADSNQRFPIIKVLRDVPKFEFSDDETIVSRFYGVMLHAHSRNVLWDKPYGSATATENEGPGCSSVDGKYGTPRLGFRHEALGGEPATGLERIECASCAYNQWKSKGLVGGSGNGKAVTNQRSVYILPFDGDGRLLREAPMELVLSVMSIKPHDEFIASLLNTRDKRPMQAVLAEFGVTAMSKGNVRWSQVTFKNERPLTAEEFGLIVDKRATFLQQMSPTSSPPVAEAEFFHEDGGASNDLTF